MKKWILLLALVLLALIVRAANATPGLTNDTSINTRVSLNSLGLGDVGIFVSYDRPSAVGDRYPNYEYSGHTLKMGSPPYYQMFYGGRCCQDSEGNCKTNYPASIFCEDGDHVRYADSNNGLDWVRSLVPVIQPGKLDDPPKPPTSYDYDNHMDPTIIEWGGTYYMYYQVMITSQATPSLCPASDGKDRQCDKFLYATSTDLVDWIKHDQPVIVNAPDDTMFIFPKVIVLDDKVWLYFGYFAGGGATFEGAWTIQSTDPVRFDFNEKIGQTGPVGWGQHAVLWPDEPQKRVHVQVVRNWPVDRQTGYAVPTLSFSKDGINWIHGDSGVPVDFPPVMSDKQHSFCNIATEVNGGLNPSPGNPGKVETFYYCATFDGDNWNVWYSDISAGRLAFVLPPTCGGTEPESTTITAIPTSFDLHALGVNGATVVHFAVWSDYNGQDDLVWHRGTNLGGGTWKAAINPSDYSVGPTKTGKINVHVYMNNGGFTNVWCGKADFDVVTSQPTPTVAPPTPTPTPGTKGYFLEVGDTAVLVLDLSMMADELAAASFLCTQQTRGLVCEFRGSPGYDPSRDY